MATRRMTLQLGAMTIFGFAGCLDASGQDGGTQPTSTGTPPDTPTEVPTTNCPPTMTPSGGASLAVRNRLDETRRGSVSIERTDGGVIFEETFELAAGEGVLEKDAITERGDYEIELTLQTEGTERWPLSLPDENEMSLGAYTVTIFIDEDIELVVLHGDPAPTPTGC